MRSLSQRFDSDFADEMLAAQGSNRILISEDKGIRDLARSEFNVASAWLQVVLMKAKDESQITIAAYGEAVRTFIESRFEFISIDAALLVSTLTGAPSTEIPKDFAILASRLGGKKADMHSHVRVAFDAIRQFWRIKKLPDLLKRASVGLLLENLTKERSVEHTIAILKAAFVYGRESLDDPEFAQYVEDWRIGHFIVLPKAKK
jgi:hypothetical protein